MHRRDFLHPRRIVRAAGHVLGAVDELQSALEQQVAVNPPPSESDQPALLRFARQAMATTFEVFLPFGESQAVDMAEGALDEVDRLEEQLTVYRDDSEMAQVNCAAADQAVPVEARLFDLLTLAARIAAETEGAFDITAGPLVKAWGFFRRQGRVPTEEERAEALQCVGMRHVALDAETKTVRFLRPGVEMNLGSIGKGYALDQAAQLLRVGWNLRAGLLHGGYSSVYAIGGELGGSRGWPVGIRHPWNPEQRLAVIRLRNQGLATSAATFQHLEYHDRKLGHLLDPRTGWPAEGMASATVVAPTATEADALATAFYILGVEKARAYCAAHPGVGALLLPAGVSAEPVVIGLAPSEIQLTPSSAGVRESKHASHDADPVDGPCSRMREIPEDRARQ